MRTEYILFFSLFLTLLACKPEKSKEEKFYPKGKKCTYTSADDVYTIDMQNSRQVALEALVDYSKGVRLIPLETTAENVFGEITKLLVYKGLYFVVDMNMANRIIVFDANGGYKFKIDDEGKAPQQYLKIWDAQINQNNQSLEIWDLPQQKNVEL